MSPLEEGVRAAARLAAPPETQGATGACFNGMGESRAEGQAYDQNARARLRRLPGDLAGLA